MKILLTLLLSLGLLTSCEEGASSAPASAVAIEDAAPIVPSVPSTVSGTPVVVDPNLSNDITITFNVTTSIPIKFVFEKQDGTYDTVEVNEVVSPTNNSFTFQLEAGIKFIIYKNTTAANTYGEYMVNYQNYSSGVLTFNADYVWYELTSQ